MSKTNTKLLVNNLMPKQQYEQSILRKRAINLANRHQEESNDNSEMFLHVSLGNDDHYGIPYQYLDEIIRPRTITPVPSSTNTIAGVIPYRGELIAVLDLPQLLKVSQTTDIERIKSSWLVIISINQVHIALLVDEIQGNYHYRAEELSHSLNNTSEKQSGPIQGIFDNKVAIIDIAVLLRTNYQTLEKNV